MPTLEPGGRLFRGMRVLAAVIVLAGAVSLTGCNDAATGPPARPPEVDVSIPVPDSITDYEVFTGRTQPINRVDIKSRVTGYLDVVYVGKDANVSEGQKIPEGGDVKKGDVLFEIQKKP